MPLPHQSTDPNQPDRQQAESTGFYLQVLHELINMGTDLARAVHQQATAEPAADATPTTTAAPDPTIAFDRIARTIRRTIVLARHVAEPLPERAASPDAHKRTAARKQIIRAVEDAIESRVHGTAPGMEDIATLCARAAAPRPPPASPSVMQTMPPGTWPGCDPPSILA